MTTESDHDRQLDALLDWRHPKAQLGGVSLPYTTDGQLEGSIVVRGRKRTFRLAREATPAEVKAQLDDLADRIDRDSAGKPLGQRLIQPLDQRNNHVKPR